MLMVKEYKKKLSTLQGKKGVSVDKGYCTDFSQEEIVNLRLFEERI